MNYHVSCVGCFSEMFVCLRGLTQRPESRERSSRTYSRRMLAYFEQISSTRSASSPSRCATKRSSSGTENASHATVESSFSCSTIRRRPSSSRQRSRSPPASSAAHRTQRTNGHSFSDSRSTATLHIKWTPVDFIIRQYEYYVQ